MKKRKENYYGGEIRDFPPEVVEKMLERQVEQGKKRDISVFEADKTAGRPQDGYSWDKTEEGWKFWHDVIQRKDFDLFFQKYPKTKGMNYIYLDGQKIEISEETAENLKQQFQKNSLGSYEDCLKKLKENSGVGYYIDSSNEIRPFYCHTINAHDKSDSNTLPTENLAKKVQLYTKLLLISYVLNNEYKNYNTDYDEYKVVMDDDGELFVTKSNSFSEIEFITRKAAEKSIEIAEDLWEEFFHL